MTLTHVWRWRTRLAERHGQACRVVARGRLNSALVAFADGELVVTSRWAVRRIATGEQAARGSAYAGSMRAPARTPVSGAPSRSRRRSPRAGAERGTAGDRRV